MSHGMGYIPALFKYLPRDLEGLTILDAGCALGEVGYYIKAFSDHPGCDLHGQPYLIGVDVYEPSVRKVQSLGVYDEVKHLDLRELLPEYMGRRIDVIMLNSVVEHIPKPDALQILGDAEKLSKYVLVSTPLGDYTHENRDEIPEFNHVSSWEPRDFTRRGYLVTVKEVLDLGKSPIAKGYRIARNLFGTRVRRKIYAVRNNSGLVQSRGFNATGRREAKP
jgi:SAM-dependent methyltransferase